MSKERKRDEDPILTPKVNIDFCVLRIPPLTAHDTEESEFHDVYSHEVAVFFRTTVRSAIPKKMPSRVTRLEPVPAKFFHLTLHISERSTDKMSVIDPVLVPDVSTAERV